MAAVLEPRPKRPSLLDRLRGRARAVDGAGVDETPSAQTVGAFAFLVFDGAERMSLKQRLLRAAKNNREPIKVISKIHDRYKRRGALFPPSALIAKLRAPVYRCMRDQLHEGVKLAKVMQPFFPASEVMMIASGENSGNYKEGFERAIFVDESATQMKMALFEALTYPVLLLIAECVMFYMIASLLVPILIGIRPVAEWPTLSVLLYYIATFVQTFGVAAAIALVVGTALTIGTFDKWTGRIRRILDDAIPPWTIYREFQGSMFMINLSALTTNDMPIDEAYKKNIEHATPWLKHHLVKSYRMLRDGASSAAAMNTGLFSQEALDELDDADTDGSLESALGEMGEDEVKQAILRLKIKANVARIFALVTVAATLLLMYVGSFMVIADMLQKVFSGGGSLPH